MRTVFDTQQPTAGTCLMKNIYQNENEIKTEMKNSLLFYGSAVVDLRLHLLISWAVVVWNFHVCHNDSPSMPRMYARSGGHGRSFRVSFTCTMM